MIQFIIKLKPDLYLKSENGKISIRISPKSGNGLSVEGDGLFMEDKCGLNDDGFIDQSGDGLRIGFDGPYTDLTNEGEYPKPGRVSASSIVHHMYTMNADLKTLNGYRNVDCILPGDIIRVPVMAIQAEEVVEEQQGIGAVEEANELAEETTSRSMALATSYVPRLEYPSSDNKFYIRREQGGYSTAIVGKPAQSPLNVFNNCFTGDTFIITKEGIVRLDHIVDKDVMVLSKGGVFRKAHGGYYGKQPIFQIKFEDGSSFKCTENHRWIVFVDGEYVVKTTLELTKEDNIPYTNINDKFTHLKSVKNLHYKDNVYCVSEPETHTMTLLGGILTGQCVGYAGGRFHEIDNHTQFDYYPLCNPPITFNNVVSAGKLETGSEPRVGAAVVWSSDGNRGHIAIVEQVRSDGSILTSESGYETYNKSFWTTERVRGNGNWGDSRRCYGFIYHPNVDPSETGAITKYTPINVLKYTIEERNGAYYVEDVLIVNKSYKLSKTFGGSNKEANEALALMQAAAKKDGLTLNLASGLRDYASQKALFEKYANNEGGGAEGYKKAEEYSARPGHSEHQTGLAFDLVKASRDINGSKEMQWIIEHCWEYGFINRYPAGKTDITGYNREDWHVRYVGKEWSKKIHDSGLCLEEYFGIPSKFVKDYDPNDY